MIRNDLQDCFRCQGFSMAGAFNGSDVEEIASQLRQPDRVENPPLAGFLTMVPSTKANLLTEAAPEESGS